MKCVPAALLALAAWLLAGCATPPAPADQLSGRLALQVAATATEPARQVSGSFELRGNGMRGEFDLLSPLGTVVARARWQPGRAELLSGAEQALFASLDELAARAFGEPLPLAALFDWLRGRPWPGAPSARAADGTGFEQLGWQVDTSRAGDGQLVARRNSPPTVMLRARLDGPP